MGDETKDGGLWRDLVAYWILGLCNNFGYVVMLSSAHDILAMFDPEKEKEAKGPDERLCNMMSTGVILLADIVPSLIIKLLAPFLPFMVHVRIAVVIGTAAVSFIIVAFASASWMAYVGVGFTSFSCGLGEVTCLAYSYAFNKNVISTWSSGTGGAGIAGALAYAALLQIGLTAKTALLVMISVPILYGVAFWLILRQPTSLNADPVTKEEVEQEDISFIEKLKYVPAVLKFMIPLVLVYFFEYFINMGLFELVHFENIFLTHEEQYRWLGVLYQIGVFISRSSVNLIQFKAVWIMAVFQGINVLYFLSEVLFYWTPSIWIVFILTLWEGLMGGGAYVNTFYTMADEVPKERQQLAMSIVAQSDSWGIVAAGILAMPVHNVICGMPRPHR